MAALARVIGISREPLAPVAWFGFWITLAAILFLTLDPHSPTLHFLNDKVAHALAFFALAALGHAAWGRRRLLILLVGLAALGAAIELLQSMPLIGRDAELFDWIADLAGIAIWLALSALHALLRKIVDRESSST